MPASEVVLTVVREWLVKADNDLTAATQILKLGQSRPVETVCFHAQQCVEKYLKAMLVYRKMPFPKSHDIHVVLALIPRRSRPAIEDDMQNRLTIYATVTRYPAAGLEVSLAAARTAVALARRVRREIRRKLPKAALPHKKT